ncbi:uncharacterized protein LOC142803582 [Rhipicephalus microplus]|uniref:uncharacterized protein LOC142803582 n=1 Tax=Rhipicephalus microplus TaxID=6941 RepID=UPI003F6CCE2B
MTNRRTSTTLVATWTLPRTMTTPHGIRRQASRTAIALLANREPKALTSSALHVNKGLETCSLVCGVLVGAEVYDRRLSAHRVLCGREAWQGAWQLENRGPTLSHGGRKARGRQVLFWGTSAV